jgi:dUTP pyrophosphatase
LPEGTFAAIYARSGIATKRGLRPANCTGICDSDYRGEYIVALHNDTDEMQSIEPGERIAQMILLPYIEMKFNEVDELSNTNRGDSGFGSTGAK